MLRSIVFSLVPLIAAPAALAGPRIIVEADPSGVAVVIDSRRDVVIVERERRVRRTRRVVRDRGYDVRPVYEREVVVYDNYYDDGCSSDAWVPPGHRKNEWHRQHQSPRYRQHGHHQAKRVKHHKKRKHKKHHNKHRNKKRGHQGNAYYARY